MDEEIEMKQAEVQDRLGARAVGRGSADGDRLTVCGMKLSFPF